MSVTITAADDGRLVTGDATSGALACDLLSAETAGPDFSVTIKKTGIGYNPLTITPEAGTIDGAATFVLRLPGQSVRLVSDGTAWHVSDRSGEEIHGRNAYGGYLRKANGVQECWNDAVGALDTQQAVGNMFRSGANIGWTFPVPFSSPPTVTPSCDAGSARWPSNDAPSADGVLLRQFSAVSSATSVNTAARAVGNWF